MRTLLTESKKRETAQMLVDIIGSHLEFFSERDNNLHTVLVVGGGQK